jgi:hypothetical protein
MAKEKSKDEIEQQVRRVLGEPAFVYFSDEVLRMRRNLIVLAFIVLAYKLSGAKVDGFQPLGIKFSGYSANSIDKAFFIFLLYNLIHFFWHSLDALQEWRLRITGTKLAFITTGNFASEHADYPKDPRQSTLMTWWLQEARKIGNISEIIQRIEDSIKQLDTLAKAKDLGELPNVNNIIRSTGQLNHEMSGLTTALNETKKVIDAARIPESLRRFDSWFKIFSFSQLARWLLLEWGTPIGLSLWALYLVYPWTQTFCTRP